MGKSKETNRLEKLIYDVTKKQGVFGCFEVTIGWFGKERVDYLTYDTKGVWRCYEIKVSKQDFYSEAAKTFVGHYNYFVLTQTLYESVKSDIPDHIGVYVENELVKRARKQSLSIEESILEKSMIRSLSREQEKLMKSENIEHLNKLKQTIKRLEVEYRNEHRRAIHYQKAICEMCEVYGLDRKEVRERFF